MIFVRCKAIHNPVISSKWKSFLMILHVELSRERSNRPNRLVLPADDKLSAIKKLENDSIVNQSTYILLVPLFCPLGNVL